MLSFVVGACNENEGRMMVCEALAFEKTVRYIILGSD
jgi:hypothetical protein